MYTNKNECKKIFLNQNFFKNENENAIPLGQAQYTKYGNVKENRILKFSFAAFSSSKRMLGTTTSPPTPSAKSQDFFGCRFLFFPFLPPLGKCCFRATHSSLPSAHIPSFASRVCQVKIDICHGFND